MYNIYLCHLLSVMNTSIENERILTQMQSELFLEIHLTFGKSLPAKETPVFEYLQVTKIREPITAQSQ